MRLVSRIYSEAEHLFASTFILSTPGVADGRVPGAEQPATWLEFIPATEARHYDLAAAYQAGRPTPSPLLGVDLI